jgi:tryptophanyl-tRNA synthetase
LIDFFYGIRPTSNTIHLGHFLHIIYIFKRIDNDLNNFYILFAETHAEISKLASETISNNSTSLIDIILKLGLVITKSNDVIQKIIPIFQNDVYNYHTNLTYKFLPISNTNKYLNNPIYKNSDNKSIAFLIYPILQSFDVLLYTTDNIKMIVFVGNDQHANVNIMKDIYKKFNKYKQFNIEFDIHENVIYDISCKQKMSKSLNNVINFNDSDGIQKYILKYKSYPRSTALMPGNPSGCNFYNNIIKNYFDDNHTIQNNLNNCILGKIGCVDCKLSIFKIIENIIFEYNKIDDIFIKNTIDINKLETNYNYILHNIDKIRSSYEGC